MSVARLAAGILWFMDALVLGVLFSTHEVRPEIFAVVLAIFVLSRLFKIKMGQGHLAGLLGVTLLIAIIGWRGFHLSPLVACAHAAPIIHAMLWLSQRNSSQASAGRVGRIAIGFLEITLAAVLSAELHVAFAIFLFVLLASIVFSLNFIETSHLLHYPEAGEKDPALVPRNFLSQSLKTSFLVLLTSLLIYPILPRIHGKSDFGQSQRNVGYTEQVNLSQGGPTVESGGGGTALILFAPDSAHSPIQATDLHLGLLKGKTLSDFDGALWKSAPSDSQINRVRPGLNRSPAPLPAQESLVEIEAIRQPFDSATLPVPYGTTQVKIRSEEEQIRPIELLSHAWMDPRGSGHRVGYHLALPRNPAETFAANRDSPPTSENLRVPSSVQTRAMNTLFARLFPPSLTLGEKIQRLRTYFIQENFKASIDDESRSNTSENPESSSSLTRLHPLEKFLFLRKKGHCELYSSAGALLLRMAGVPTRLVAGFRISRSPRAGVLTVRTGDAHAWLEYWSPERGWLPLDLTPRVTLPPSLFEFARSLYDATSALWYRHLAGDSDGSMLSRIMNYGSSSGNDPRGSEQALSRMRKSLEDWLLDRRTVLLALLSFVIALGISGYLVVRTWFPWILSIRWKVREGPAWLKRERVRMEQYLARILYQRWIHSPNEDFDLPQAARDLHARHGEKCASYLAEWDRIYKSARFGKIGMYRAETRAQLRTHERALRESVKSCRS